MKTLLILLSVWSTAVLAENKFTQGAAVNVGCNQTSSTTVTYPELEHIYIVQNNNQTILEK